MRLPAGLLSTAALSLRPPACALQLYARRASRLTLTSFSDGGSARDVFHQQLEEFTEHARDLPVAELCAQLAELSVSAASLAKLKEPTVGGMRVADLRAALEERGLPSSGLKAELQSRLLAELALEQPRPPAQPSPSAPPPTSPSLSSPSPAGFFLSAEMPGAAMQEQLDRTVRRCAGIGPQSGIFTDGGCEPNPGPGGWGVVAVHDARVQWSLYARERESTTNNRMELSAIIAALERLPTASEETIYSDSKLCVQTLNDWAPKWEANGWKRAGGEPVKNLDLVQLAYGLRRARPKVRIEWLKAHAGSTWNEYADTLASWSC